MVLWLCCGSGIASKRNLRNSLNSPQHQEQKPKNYILSQNTLGTYLDVLFFTPETGGQDICDEATFLPDVSKNLVLLIPWLNPKDSVLMDYSMLYLNYSTDVMVVRYGIHDLLQLSRMRDMTADLGRLLTRLCPAYNSVIVHSIQGGTFIMCDLLSRNHLVNVAGIIVERLACDWINLPLDGLIRHSNSLVKRLSFRHDIEPSEELQDAISQMELEDNYVTATLPGGGGGNQRESHCEPPETLSGMNSLRRRQPGRNSGNHENPYYLHPNAAIWEGSTDVNRTHSTVWAHSQQSIASGYGAAARNSANYSSGHYDSSYQTQCSSPASPGYGHYGNGYATMQPRPPRNNNGHVFRRHSQSFIEHTQTAMTSFSSIIPQMKVPVLIFATGKDNCDVDGIKAMVSNWRFQGVSCTLRYWKKCTGISLLESHNSAFVKTLDTFLERYHLNNP